MSTYTLSRHVYEGHTDQNAPHCIGLITCTSPLPAMTFCQVSPNPMALSKPILLRRPQRTFSDDL